ncbi:MAG: four helix bundle protein [Phycisphaeraceae bacterium]|nr:MAG: four helix bundle protein [Phycisphaeraceae bacterium]
MARDHRNLKAFNLADELVLAVYEETRGFPKEELFGLTSQLRRAAVSVAANIVEGAGRSGDKEFAHFLGISHGSLREAGYYISLAHRLRYLNDQQVEQLNSMYEETARVLSGLHRAVKKMSKEKPKSIDPEPD